MQTRALVQPGTIKRWWELHSRLMITTPPGSALLCTISAYNNLPSSLVNLPVSQFRSKLFNDDILYNILMDSCKNSIGTHLFYSPDI